MHPALSLSPVLARAVRHPGLHISDGLLGPSIALAMWALAAICLALALRRLRADLGDRLVPLMGVMAAFIFAAQMINFPVAGGTSGHLLGGVLAAVLLGPWAAMLVMAVVIGLQGLLFQDGGLLVMGANIVNMGVLTVTVGYGMYRSVRGRDRSIQFLAIAVAAWLSVMGAALATSLELWLSGTAPLRLVVPALLLVHAAIGIGEALITVGALAFVWRARPDLATGAAPAGRGWVVAGLLVALGVVLLSPLASLAPDGLERVAEDLGFLEAGTKPPIRVMPDYVVPLLGASDASTIVAGIAGLLVAVCVAIGLGRLAMRRRPTARAGEPRTTPEP